MASLLTAYVCLLVGVAAIDETKIAAHPAGRLASRTLDPSTLVAHDALACRDRKSYAA
jgi:hypothetical protein